MTTENQHLDSADLDVELDVRHPLGDGRSLRRGFRRRRVDGPPWASWSYTSRDDGPRVLDGIVMVSVASLVNQSVHDPAFDALDGVALASGSAILLLGQTNSAEAGTWIWSTPDAPLCRPPSTHPFATRSVPGVGGLILVTGGEMAGLWQVVRDEPQMKGGEVVYFVADRASYGMPEYDISRSSVVLGGFTAPTPDREQPRGETIIGYATSPRASISDPVAFHDAGSGVTWIRSAGPRPDLTTGVRFPSP